MKNQFRQLALISTLAIVVALIFSQTGYAESIAESITSVGSGTALPDFETGHANQAYQSGASNITSAILYTIDFLKYILGAITALLAIISGAKMVMATQKSGDLIDKEKSVFSYSLTGLFLIIIAPEIIKNVFFGEEGEMYRSGADIQAAAERGVLILQGVIGLMRVVIPSVAILFIIYAGFRLVTSGGDNEKMKKAKTQITWAIVGLISAGLGEILVFRIFFPDQGSRLSDFNAFNKLVVDMTNFISGFLSTVAVTMLIYAGYTYVMAGFDAKNIDKAKKIAKGAIIGLFIAMAAFAIVNTFIKIEPTVNVKMSDQTTTNVSGLNN